MLDDPDEKEYPGPPGRRLGVRPTVTPSTKVHAEIPEMPRKGLTDWQKTMCL
jgi:hypothetical protein